MRYEYNMSDRGDLLSTCLTKVPFGAKLYLSVREKLR